MKEYLSIAILVAGFGALIGFELSNDRYQSLSHTNGKSLVQTDTRTGAMRFCLVQKAEGSSGKPEGYRVECGKWTAKQG